MEDPKPQPSQVIIDDAPPPRPEGEIVRVLKGPFKGRTYRRNKLGQLELIAAPKQLHRRRHG